MHCLLTAIDIGGNVKILLQKLHYIIIFYFLEATSKTVVPFEYIS